MGDAPMATGWFGRGKAEPAADRCVLETDAGATKADEIVAKKAGGKDNKKNRRNLLKSKYDTPKALEDALWRHFGEWGELESMNVIHRLSIAFPRYRLRTSAEFAKEAMTGQTLDKGEILSIRWAHDDPNPVAQDSIDRADKDALVGLMQAKGICLTPAPFEYPSDYQLPDNSKRQRLTDGTGADVGGGSDPNSLSAQYPDLAYPNTNAQFAASAASAATTSASNAAAASGSTVEIPTGPNGAMKTVDLASPEYAVYYADYCAKYYAQQAVLARFGIDVNTIDATPEEVPVVVDTATEEVEEGEDEEEEEVEVDVSACWTKQVDESTGAMYYFNTATGESSWVDPTKKE
eukprot:gene39440-48738_t